MSPADFRERIQWVHGSSVDGAGVANHTNWVIPVCPVCRDLLFQRLQINGEIVENRNLAQVLPAHAEKRHRPSRDACPSRDTYTVSGGPAAVPDTGFGTIISFDVRGDSAAADGVCAGLQLIQHATSLGAVESTIERRASIPGQEHLPPALLRLSVGIEGVEDLWTDLDRALRNVAKMQ